MLRAFVYMGVTLARRGIKYRLFEFKTAEIRALIIQREKLKEFVYKLFVTSVGGITWATSICAT